MYYLCRRHECAMMCARNSNNQIPLTMAKKDELELEVTSTEEVKATPNFDKWKKGIMSKNPNLTEESDMEDFYAASTEGYETEHEYAKKNRGEVEQMDKLLKAHPELAAFMDNVVNSDGEDLGEAFFNLGELTKAYATGEIDSPKYKARLEERKAKDAEIASKQDAQAVAFEDACKEMGVDPEEISQALMEKLFNPMAAYELSKDVWKNLINMLNYEDDVTAAEVRGRNANITAQRKKLSDASDGIPHKPSAAAPAQQPKPKTDLDIIAERRAAKRKL